MNRAQKEALINLIGAIMCIAVPIFLYVEIAVLKRLPTNFFEKYWVPIAACIFTPIFIIFYRKKQSPAEVDADERDKLIQKRAVLVSFVSVWILLYAASIIPWFFVGLDGSIPVWMLPILNICVGIIVLLIHSIAVLVQYVGGGKENE